MDTQYFNISNALQAIVSEFNGIVMLELRGQFKPKRLSANKLSLVLDNAEKLLAIANADNFDYIRVSSDLDVLPSTFNGVRMLELRGQFKPVSISENVIYAICSHVNELRKIIRDNPASAIVENEKSKAKSSLAKSSAEIGTDKKSAKDVESTPAPAPVMFNGHATIQAYLLATYPQISKSDADLYATDSDAQKEYASYLESLKRPTFSQMKEARAKSFSEMKKENGSKTPTSAIPPKDGNTQEEKRAYYKNKREAAKNEKAATDTKVSVSYKVRVLESGHVKERIFPFVSQADFIAQLHNKELLSWNEAYKSPVLVKDFKITNQGYTQSHLFQDVLNKKGFLKQA